MKKQMMVRSGVAGAIAAAGLVVGGVAVANADDAASPAQGTDGETVPRDGRGGPGGPGPADSAELAEALGVGEDDLAAAMKAVREQSADRAEMAAALAEQLDLGEDEVTAALDEAREAADADRRTELSDRLDAAVDDGDLTGADATSVLKAFDAGALGGPGPR